MSDILSREEMDALLKEESDKKSNVHQGRTVKPYDFHTPERFSKEHLKIFQILMEDFCTRIRNHFSAHLRVEIDVSIASIKQTVFKEFLSLPSPTYIAIFSMPPLEGSAVIEIDPAFLIGILDHLLGSEKIEKTVRRELTALEAEASYGLANRVLLCFKDAFEKTVHFDTKIESLDFHPQFVVIASPNEAAVILTLEMKFGEMTGLVNLCLPYLILESLIPYLSLKKWFMFTQKKRTLALDGMLKKHLGNTKIDVVCELGSCDISIQELFSMKEGDLLLVDKDKDSLMTLKIGGIPKLQAQVGLVDRHIAARVISLVED